MAGEVIKQKERGVPSSAHLLSGVGVDYVIFEKLLFMLPCPNVHFGTYFLSFSQIITHKWLFQWAFKRLASLILLLSLGLSSLGWVGSSESPPRELRA